MTTRADADPEGATAPLSAGGFLLADDGLATLQERLVAVAEDRAAGLDAVRGPVRAALQEEISSAAASLLDVDVAGVAVAGWRRHHQLLAAARATAATPGLTQVVELATHEVTSTWKPCMEVQCGSQVVARLAFELLVALEVVGLAASVTDGRLTRLGCGRCTLTVTFRVGGAPLATRTAAVDLRVHVPLGGGIALLDTAVPLQAAR